MFGLQVVVINKPYGQPFAPLFNALVYYFQKAFRYIIVYIYFGVFGYFYGVGMVLVVAKHGKNIFKAVAYNIV